MIFLLLGFQLIARTSTLEARNVNKQKEAADDVDDDDDDAAERSLWTEAAELLLIRNFLLLRRAEKSKIMFLPHPPFCSETLRKLMKCTLSLSLTHTCFLSQTKRALSHTRFPSLTYTHTRIHAHTFAMCTYTHTHLNMQIPSLTHTHTFELPLTAEGELQRGVNGKKCTRNFFPKFSWRERTGEGEGGRGRRKQQTNFLFAAFTSTAAAATSGGRLSRFSSSVRLNRIWPTLQLLKCWI